MEEVKQWRIYQSARHGGTRIMNPETADALQKHMNALGPWDRSRKYGEINSALLGFRAPGTGKGLMVHQLAPAFIYLCFNETL